MGLLFRLMNLPGLALCAAFLYLANNLESLLRQSPSLVFNVFRTAIGLQVAYQIVSLIDLVLYGAIPSFAPLILIPITWYLLKQSRRLSQELNQGVETQVQI